MQFKIQIIIYLIDVLMNKSILFVFLFIQGFMNAQLTERSLSSEKWQFRNTQEQKWLPAKIPGNVHLYLMDKKMIPDPFQDENEKKSTVDRKRRLGVSNQF